jgi:nucleoid DNA-binding protein
MDIAKYIGQFLLKNHFCYVHGLGNMELRKLPATHDGQALHAPSYEIVVTPGGSIDDNLANFIATNEQISISKAANALRDYSIQARKDMAQGKEVPIPNLGKFVEENGKVKFITDENFRFTPASIPTIKNSKQLEEQNSKPVHKPSYPAPHKADSVNWSMVVLVAVLLLILCGGGYGIYYYTAGSNKSNTAPPVPVAAIKDTTRAQAVVVDSTHGPIPDSLAQPLTMPVDSTQVITYKMSIKEYRKKTTADNRVIDLGKSGVHAETFRVDSADYLVLAAISCRPADTTHVKDSLSRLYAFKNVRIFK